MHRFINNWKRLEGFSVEIIASKDKKFTQKFKISYYLLPLRTILKVDWNFFSLHFSEQNPTQIWIMSVCRGYANVQLHHLRRSVWTWTFVAAVDIGSSSRAKLRLAGEPESEAARESSHHYRAERGNKAGSWEITAVYKPSAWFASVISLSALVHQILAGGRLWTLAGFY